MLLTITNPFRSIPLLSACALTLAAGAAHAQYPPYTPPPPPLKTGPCVPTKEYPCTPLPSSEPPAAAPASKFPFPGDAPDQPAAPATPAAKAFPFPEDADRPPATPAPASPAAKSFPFPDSAYPPAESSSSSSNSSSSDPTAEPGLAQPALADKGSSGSTRMERRAQRRLLPKVEDLDAREAEDLQVSHYYATTGNFLAAYLRAQDAVKTIPDDPLAHFALAESAAKLNKKDEAIAEYKLYLKLEPEGEKAKAAQRALAELVPK
jgi:hypothetical protein